MKISDISQYLQAMTLSNSCSSATDTAKSTSSDTDLDSYVSSAGSSSSAIPSETYNNIMEIIKANKQASGESASAPTDQEIEDALLTLKNNSSSDSGTAAETSSIASASGSSSSDSSSSDNSSDTETETVMGPDGSIYLRTTTTDDSGNETVTVTKLSGPQMPSQNRSNGIAREMPPMMPPMSDLQENNSSSDTAEETVQNL